MNTFAIYMPPVCASDKTEAPPLGVSIGLAVVFVLMISLFVFASLPPRKRGGK